MLNRILIQRIGTVLLVLFLSFEAYAIPEIVIFPAETRTVELAGGRVLEVFQTLFAKKSKTPPVGELLETTRIFEDTDFNLRVWESGNRYTTLSLPMLIKQWVIRYLKDRPSEFRTSGGFNSFDFLLYASHEDPGELRKRVDTLPSLEWQAGDLLVYQKRSYLREEEVEYSDNEGFFAVYLGEYQREKLVLCKPYQAKGLVITTVSRLSQATEVESPLRFPSPS